MAGALVGGALFSGFINVVLDRLLSLEAVNFIRGKKLDKELLERLETALIAAEALLTDAEHKQFQDRSVKKWLDILKDAVYDADDLLDHVLTEAATPKKHVDKLRPGLLNPEETEMVTEMEEIVRRIEDLEKRKYILGLKHIPKENLSWRTPSTSLVEGEIYGRENDQEAMIKLLLDDNAEGNISVIPIVGMGGVGKTTLAQWLYNNEDLMKEFHLKAWVCVSEEFDIVKITKTMIAAVTSSSRPCEIKDLNLLQEKLKDNLIGKKFFIVLDDVWSHDRYHWNNLKKPLHYGIKGSKVLITTRNEMVASVVQTCPPYLLNELSDEYCWFVFANHACFPESKGNSKLEAIGRKIVKKCKGLPLAAQTLGSLLRGNDDVKEWDNICKCEIWKFSIEDSKIVPALLISYYHLPPQLKRCFIHCSLYPKDYWFEKDELILLWMAEDLLEQPDRGKTLEEVGSKCFDDLASRLFFKPVTANKNSFVMHDLIHDLATFVAGEFYFRSEEQGKVDQMSTRIRHCSYGRLSHQISTNSDAIGGVKPLRTLLHFNFSLCTENTTFIILSTFKCLRVLSFAFLADLVALPDSIGELIHLRYLNLSKTRIKTLPESLGDLYNLQTLKLLWCDRLTMLPNSMQNLANLRHLDVGGTGIEEMPRGISKLKILQFLSDFIVGKHDENGLRELGMLSNLRGSLSIRKLENIANSSEAAKARIRDKTHIELLKLKWSDGGDMVTSVSSGTEREILDELKPHEGLQVLTVRRYRGTKFPDWVGHSSYYNMTRVSLENCQNCCMLPSLGQLPSLKSLDINSFHKVVIIDVEFYKRHDDHLATSFPSLEELFFSDMSCWGAWHSSEPNAFPQLKHLVISYCLKLRGNLPDHLPALERLTIDQCDELVSSLPRAPAIRELNIRGNNKVRMKEISLSLQSLSIDGCELVKSMFEAMNIGRPTCLQSLRISNCSCAVSFSGNRIPGSMITLEIKDCRILEFPNHQQHQLLKSLEIDNSCDSLTSFPLGSFPNLNSLKLRDCKNLESLLVSQDSALQYLYITGCDKLETLKIDSFPEGGLPPNLEELKIHRCKKLKSLPCHMNTLLPRLRDLEIEDCPEIDSFPDGGLPPNLKTLKIHRCKKLKSLPCHMNTLLPRLRDLKIEDCPEIDSFPDGGCPPNLETLEIRNCKKLKSLPCYMNTLLPKLWYLRIEDCPEIDSFPDGGCPPNLETLQIRNCKKLKSLPCHMNTLLPKLWYLEIEDCPEIDSFPDGGLPPNLKTLGIDNSEKLLGCLSSMGMHDGLTCPRIYGRCESVKSFPKEGSPPQLPSLTTLELIYLSSLETLECKELLHLTSLQTLMISWCPKLEKMTGEKLPTSLIQLHIYECPLLEERCKMKHPQVWPKISHILDIVVDHIKIT